MFLAAPPDYKKARDNVEPVGNFLGKFIKFLLEQGSDYRRFHLIGFSLGAHIVGYAGKALNGILPRITGK